MEHHDIIDGDPNHPKLDAVGSTPVFVSLQLQNERGKSSLHDTSSGRSLILFDRRELPNAHAYRKVKKVNIVVVTLQDNPPLSKFFGDMSACSAHRHLLLLCTNHIVLVRLNGVRIIRLGMIGDKLGMNPDDVDHRVLDYRTFALNSIYRCTVISGGFSLLILWYPG
jgi:hypothetical protein